MTPRRLTATEVSDLAQTLPMWQVVDEQLLREIQAPTYMIAINWVVAIAGAAESLDHHPDIDIRWRTLRIALITHSTGCLTELDLDLARLIDTVLSTRA
ncbi:MAG: 4a-hydroxytetrahydrobiopterin dehydratase [Actinobacteria bacterium]|uniref:4a-hydroxytetrahydrobiopterin dehydratase n=1 Tax=freshwater metagenome TaxID=449393 RepID=A0A6J7AIA5_9ZZZZ|nr:4a-hydroxytetrahydrobiopterin dehydratase [Actinomycetota bacterium]